MGFVNTFAQRSQTFTVLDPGHGGKILEHLELFQREKDIVLSVAKTRREN